MKFVYLNYYYHEDLTDPIQVIRIHRFSSGFIDYLKNETELYTVKHMNYEGSLVEDGIHNRFFRSRNKFRHIPFSSHRYIAELRPDVILSEGLVFPFQLIYLRALVGKKCILLVQHQGERPFRGIKKWFQKWADRSIDAYLFTSVHNAEPWLKENIISSAEKCFEVLSASTTLTPGNKEESRKKTGMTGQSNFLWVGRLIDIKDPLTVLKAFAAYLRINSEARLYMIYQVNDLLEAVKNQLAEDPVLQQAVFLLGKKEVPELKDWYTAANFFILGSHREGSGYALVEAMSCGCIPVVTDIPSFRKMTDEGRLAYLFEKGNAEDLLRQLKRSEWTTERAEAIMDYTRTSLSSKRISEQILQVCSELLK